MPHDGHDPSSAQFEKKANLVSIVGFLGTWNSQFLFALRYTYVDARRVFRRTLSTIMNATGFIYSFGVELILTSRSTFKRKWMPILRGLQIFLKTSGIAVELERGLNRRILDNIGILAKIQDKIIVRRGAKGPKSNLDCRSLAALCSPEEMTTLSDKQQQGQNHALAHSKEEAKHYVRFAAAAYGIEMIEAAEVAVYGSIQWKKKVHLNSSYSVVPDTDDGRRRLKRASSSYYDPEMLRSAMSAHINIPEGDIYMMNVSDDKVETLRHFVAIDREHNAVVLAVRGTLALSEVIIDIGAFSRPFCGGEAHSEIANSAERIWEASGELILQLLAENDGFELVICGHSLGGGAAVLLNILLHEEKCSRLGGRRCRCFSFASPPVFTPLDAAKEAVEACTNYIHGNDCVPFLSIDSIRHIFAAINTIENCNLSALNRSRILWGSTNEIDILTLLRVERALTEALPVKRGAPVLLIPASVNVWMRQIEQDLLVTEDVKFDPDVLEDILVPVTPFDSVLADSVKLAHLGVQLASCMLEDHFPNGYEAALYNLQD